MTGFRGIAVLGVLLLAGCGNAAVDRMGSGGEGIVWPEHEALFNEELFGGADYAFQMGDARSAVQVVNDPEFQSAVADFKNSEIPSAISNRTALRDELNAALDKMIAAGEENNVADLKAALEEAKTANQSLMAQERDEE